MRKSKALDRIAVCSWSLQPRSPKDLVEKLFACGIQKVQLALEPLLNDPEIWSNCSAALAEAGIEIISGMMGCVGEDYSTIQSIQDTGGVMPDNTWPATLANLKKAAPLARELGLKLVTTHAGFIPHAPDSVESGKGVDRIQQVASAFAGNEVSLALETGQEPAPVLVEFLRAVNRSDVGVNFDPANMLLYGSGEPIAALSQLLPFIRQVHIKDALPSGIPGTWGTEVPAGAGIVNWKGFFQTLDGAGYQGHFVIEREAGHSRIADIVAARELVLMLNPDSRTAS
jgi:sugar phosphate isomerase/epimerase